MERWGYEIGIQCQRPRRLIRGPGRDEENRTHGDQNDYDENSTSRTTNHYEEQPIHEEQSSTITISIR